MAAIDDAAPAACEAQPLTGALLASIITPARNAGRFIDECAASVVAQTHRGPLEWLVFDDGSSDDTRARLEAWRAPLEARNVQLRVCSLPPCSPSRGAGFGRNRAVELASPHTALFVFLDADDVMAPRRVEALLAALATAPANTLFGSRYWRQGDGRPRDHAWHNGMSAAQLLTQRLRETTLAQPTWAMTPATFAAAGRYAEDAPHNAEDLQFFYAHLARGGGLLRLDEELVMYRHTEDSAAASRSVPAALIWRLRVQQLEAVLQQPPWCEGFTIWNAGKEGKKLYKSLSEATRRLVTAFADVDTRKLAHGAVDDMAAKRRIPILHFRDAAPPLLLCVKPGLTGDGPDSFEANLASLNLREGIDYLHFS